MSNKIITLEHLQTNNEKTKDWVSNNYVDLINPQKITGQKTFQDQGSDIPVKFVNHHDNGISILANDLGGGFITKSYSGEFTLHLPENENGTLATQNWVNGVITGKVDYLGTVAGQGDLVTIVTSGSPVNAGDYCRASASFYLYDNSASDHNGEQVHPGDILIYKASSGVPVPSGYYWDVIHTEDPGNYASLEGHNVFNGYNTFNGGVEINCDYSSHANSKTKGFSVNVDYSGQTMNLQLNPGGLAIGDYSAYAGMININPRSVMDQITYYPVNTPGTYTYTLPTKTGTFALLSDIPTNYVTTNTDQTISGGKTFNIHTNIDTTDRTRFEVYHTAESGMGLFDYTFSCGAYWPCIEGNGKSMYISSTGFQRGDDAGSSTWFTLPTESLDPATHDLTLATRGWIKANAICSSTIDQEFFNSLY